MRFKNIGFAMGKSRAISAAGCLARRQAVFNAFPKMRLNRLRRR